MIGKRACALSCVLAFCGISVARAQQIQVNRENRTIAVTATETVEADAEIAVVELGYHNYAKTHDRAYENNVCASNKIIHAMLGSGISGSSIDTEGIQLSRVDPEGRDWTAEQKAEHQFQATQSWKIHIAVADAQKIVDLAVRAGANQVTGVDWQVKDPEALQAKAGAAALAKARKLAESMATRLGAKLGELIYASNQTPALSILAKSYQLVPVSPPPTPPHLQLFPKKVTQKGTVYAVFALQ
jgi:uncharacterized protein YggE